MTTRHARLVGEGADALERLVAREPRTGLAPQSMKCRPGRPGRSAPGGRATPPRRPAGLGTTCDRHVAERRRWSAKSCAPENWRRASRRYICAVAGRCSARSAEGRSGPAGRRAPGSARREAGGRHRATPPSARASQSAATRTRNTLPWWRCGAEQHEVDTRVQGGAGDEEGEREGRRSDGERRGGDQQDGEADREHAPAAAVDVTHEGLVPSGGHARVGERQVGAQHHRRGAGDAVGGALDGAVGSPELQRRLDDPAAPRPPPPPTRPWRPAARATCAAAPREGGSAGRTSRSNRSAPRARPRSAGRRASCSRGVRAPPRARRRATVGGGGARRDAAGGEQEGHRPVAGSTTAYS